MARASASVRLHRRPSAVKFFAACVFLQYSRSNHTKATDKPANYPFIRVAPHVFITCRWQHDANLCFASNLQIDDCRMTEVSFTKFMWEREREGPMESCYKLYTWINHTILMLLLQIFWKVSQISDYFKEKSIEDKKTEGAFIFTPLSKESKFRRHIRSMSDVQSSTPYRLPFRSRKGSNRILTYDSDTRSKRIMSYNRQKLLESSDSSDFDVIKNQRSIEHNIMKHTDSMRIL